jgi:hypothetical protein
MGALTQTSLQRTGCMSCRRQSSLTQFWISVQEERVTGTFTEFLLGSVVLYPLQHLLYY